MYAKQYEITLPADYDMGIIRKRVADFGPLLDDRSGLGLKAYLIREKGVSGSPVNQYAPFYLWNEVGAMGHFLLGGGGFQGIERDFGRPVVRQWMGVACFAGPSRDTAPRAASRVVTPFTGEVDRHVAELGAAATRDGVHTAALAVDPHHWQLLRFVVWNDAVPAEEISTERYEVLHLSAPGLDALPRGRHW